MKTLSAFAVPLAVLAVLLVSRAASATAVADCQARIATLEDVTAATTFLRGDKGVKTQDQLLQHLAQASDELTLNDPAEALRQMKSYSTNVDRAVGSATLTQADADVLLAGADGVVACIQQIQ